MAWELTTAVHLEIDGIPLATPAWEITNLAPLFDGPEVRGQNRVLPGGGVVAHPRRITESRRLLPIEVRGTHDPEGDPHPDPFVGLETNCALLDEHLLSPPTSGTTRHARLHLPSGAVRSGRVQVIPPLGLTPGGWYVLNGVLDLLLVDGELAPEITSS